MKRFPLHFLLTIINLLFLCSVNFAQQDSSKVTLLKITLSDGSELIGYIASKESLFLNFITITNIKIQIPKDKISNVELFDESMTKSIKPVKEDTVSTSEPDYPDHNRSRMFLFPTAKSMKTGEVYISINELFFPFAAIGIQEIFILGGGISIIPGAHDQIYYLSPKVTPIHFNNFDLAGGVFYANSAGSGNNDGIGVIYGIGTYGNEKASITAGLGWGFYGNDFAEKPIAILGGEIRISRNMKLISENWIPFNSEVQFIVLGVRFFNEHLTGDVAMMRPLGIKTSGFPFLPWLGLTYNFSLK